jgi:signal peptidase II
MSNRLLQTGLRWLWVALVVILIDRLTKVMAQTYLIAYEPKAVMPCFNLTLAYNKGAAFSFLSYAAGWQVWFFGLLALAISTVLLVWLKRLSHHQRWVAIALAMIIGGALGNLWDRISYGHVIDFLEFYVSTWHWPIFNVADSAICVGAGMLVIDAFCSKEK